MKVRLIFDEPSRGARNMAVDEALLASVSQGSPATLRIYRWSEPTLSLGYFQKYANRREHAASLGCAVVRRPSGGGAILHDREWTYSFTAPITGRDSSDRRRLYECIHAALVESLRARGISAALWDWAAVEQESAPFLCFQRRCPGDVVLAGHKIAGSAQRRTKTAVLQHGSVLVSASPVAPELPGILDLADRQPEPEDLMNEWLGRVAAGMGLDYVRANLSQQEIHTAMALAEGRHERSGWLKKR